jgi:hypothetical protein
MTQLPQLGNESPSAIVDTTFMKAWLRLTIVTITVGGGFTGIALTFPVLQSHWSSQSPRLANLFLILLFLVLNACVTASGLLFVHDPSRIFPLIAALAVQIPSISSSLFVYKFAAGLALVFSIDGPAKSAGNGIRLGSEFVLGNRWTISLSGEHPFSLGVNLVALATLILLWRLSRTPVALLNPKSSSAIHPPDTTAA